MRKGKEIGRGTFRTVYEDTDNQAQCIKIGDPDHNRREWWISENHPELPIARCLSISEDGRTLVQQRGKKASKAAKKYPNCFVPRSMRVRSHWVVIDGKTLICDYSHPDTFYCLGGRDEML